MSDAVTVRSGFFGKIPCRGDFVRAGLSSSLVEPLDAWWEEVLSGSREILGADWTGAWMEAPVWRFAFANDVCGPDAVLGLWMPSTDRAGRLFPLSFAATAPRWTALATCGGFLEVAEAAGLAALERDLDPDAIAAAVARWAGSEMVLAEPAAGGSAWWTDGSPRVRPVRRAGRGLPDAAAFAIMLQDGNDGPSGTEPGGG